METPVHKLDPELILDWKSLEGREKSQQEINRERLDRWRKKYDAYVSMLVRRNYLKQSKNM